MDEDTTEETKPIKVELPFYKGGLDHWKYESCEAECGVGSDWATIYSIESKERNKGHATVLLLKMKGYYEGKGLVFGGSVALNSIMEHLYQKCGITEY